MRLRALGCLYAIAAVLAGCGSDTCAVKGVRHVVVDVNSDDPHIYGFSSCVQSDQCEMLCRSKALELAPADVGVLSCMRVQPDGGTDGGADGGADSLTVDITYKEYAFCGV
jgi:hypothetical protein